MTDAPFAITREEVLSLAAQRLVDAYCGDPDLSETANRLISERVKELFENGIKKKVDSFLHEEMQRILGQEIVPVDIWGERTGKPTTLKQILADRAKEFWGVKVDSEGKEAHWGGTGDHGANTQGRVQERYVRAH